MTHYHLIGIGGIGMSAIAHLLQQQNKTVTGSDLSSSSLTEKLKKLGVGVSLGHCKERVKKNYHVVYSSAINESNPEYEQAKKLNCHLLHRSEMLANIIQAFDCLAVTGSHGKTTTSALLTYVLQKANQSPSYALGGVIQNLDSHADIGKGRYFIIEADESDGSFINFHPLGAIITNMEYEHVEYYKSVGELHKSFDQFYQQVRNKNLLFWCKDKVAMPWIEGISYGFDSSCQLQIKDYEQFQWCSSFSIRYKGKCHNAIPINLIGKHNIYNAASVFGLCLELGIEPEVIKGAFKTFPGVKRRCQQHQDQQVVIIRQK